LLGTKRGKARFHSARKKKREERLNPTSAKLRGEVEHLPRVRGGEEELFGIYPILETRVAGKKEGKMNRQ